MKNTLQEGKALNVILAAAVLSGGVVVMGSLCGVANTSGLQNDTVAVSVEGVFALPKAAGSGFTQGTQLYWDATAGTVTSAAGALPKIGFAAYAASSDATTVAVLLRS